MNVYKVERDDVLLWNDDLYVAYRDRKKIWSCSAKEVSEKVCMPFSILRKYKVDNPNIKIFRDTDYIKLWSHITRSKPENIAKAYMRLKQEDRFWRKDIDKFWFKTDKIKVKGKELGKFYARLDLNKKVIDLVKPVRMTGSSVIGNLKARHPHIYQYTEGKYRGKLHVCVGRNRSQIATAIRNANLIDAVECVTEMLNDAKWTSGITIHNKKCKVCDEVFFNRDQTVCSECKD